VLFFLFFHRGSKHYDTGFHPVKVGSINFSLRRVGKWAVTHLAEILHCVQDDTRSNVILSGSEESVLPSRINSHGENESQRKNFLDCLPCFYYG
jgi:hypothetical protein